VEPLFLRKSGSSGNSGSVARNSALDHRGGLPSFSHINVNIFLAANRSVKHKHMNKNWSLKFQRYLFGSRCTDLKNQLLNVC
jgi:hypothetical protein